MASTLGIDPRNPKDYTGLKMSAVPVVQAPRQPTTSDRRYPLWTEWRISANPDSGSEGDYYKLVKFSGGDAIWVMLANGGSSSGLLTISDNANTAVEPDSNGNIQITAGAGISVVSDVGNNQIAISYTGGGGSVPVASFDVDTSSGAGTDPVTPTGAGVVTISGTAVAQAGVPVQIASRAANAYDVEVQVASTNTGAPSNKNKAGLSQYDDTYFTVDADGYVSLSGINTFQWVNVSGASQNMAVNTGYISNYGGGVLNFSLPGTAARGTVMRIVGNGSGGWTITQNAGQKIHFNSESSTTGVGGSISSNNRYDCIELLCTVANNSWVVLSSTGILTVV